jgi:sortase A
MQLAMKHLNLLLGFSVAWGVSACSGLITIVPIATPEPTPSESTQAFVSNLPPSNSDAPTHLASDAINLDVPVVEMGWRVVEQRGQAVSVWNIPENEAGWHLNSARPGEGGNVVISGHNNSTGGHVFGKLEELAVGDQITVGTGQDSSFVYQISETQIVKAFNASPENLEYLQTVIQPTDQEQLTLVTCWPGWTNTHRLIIIAHPLKPGQLE